MSKAMDCVLTLLSVLTIGYAGVAYGQSGFVYSQQPYPYAPTSEYVADCEDEGVASAPGLFFGAEWLSWQVKSANQSYATTIDPVWLTERETFEPSVAGNGVRGKIGFRTGGMWDVSVGYTSFDADDEGYLDWTVDPDSVLRTPRSRLDLPVEEVGYKDSTSLNILDFEVGRHVQSCSFDFRPFGGFRWLELEQTQEGAYGYYDREYFVNQLSGVSRLKAYGLRMGVEANVDLFGGLRVFGRGAGSVLVGDIKSKGVETDEIYGEILNRNFRTTVATPELEAAAGLAWNIGGLEIKGGYELNTIFNACKANTTNYRNENSDVLMHGFFAGASWNY